MKTQHPAIKYGTDKQFLEWLSYQPSCLDGAFNQWIDGVGRNIACHVRRANNSGTGIKPQFSAVPMTDAQHKLQSQKGEVEVISKYFPELWNPEMAKQWFDNQVENHVMWWIESKMRARR